MKSVKVILQSTSPYSQGRYHATPKMDKEGHDDYEKRTWRERLHVNKKGNVVIPPLQFKNCLSESAKFLARLVLIDFQYQMKSDCYLNFINVQISWNGNCRYR